MNDYHHNAGILSYNVISMTLFTSQKNYAKNIIIKMLREGHKLRTKNLKRKEEINHYKLVHNLF